MKFASRALRRVTYAWTVACTSAVACAVVGSPAIASAAPDASYGGQRAIASPATSVPRRFLANSITWTSPQRGWVLGAKSCAQGKGTCPDSQVIGTTNRGHDMAADRHYQCAHPQTRAY